MPASGPWGGRRYDAGVVVNRARRRLGIALIALGLLTIVVSVVVVLEVANGPGAGPRSFAARRGYDQVKADIHRSFPYGLLAGLAGLGLAMVGSRLAKSAEPRA